LLEGGGPLGLPLYRAGRGGVLPLGFTGMSTPLSKQVMRFIPLILGETDEHVHALSARCGEVLARVRAVSQGGER
jgi:hypothetical protein